MPAEPTPLARLLIVDDEPEMLGILEEYFTGLGYSVVTAAKGTDALARLHEHRPAVVLLDIIMPGMSGLDVLTHIRAHDPGIRVIMVSATENIALAREALRRGAADYASKPFDFDHLDQVVFANAVGAPVAPFAAPSSTGSAIPPAYRALAMTVFQALHHGPAAPGKDRLRELTLAAIHRAATARWTEALASLDELGPLIAGAAAALGPAAGDVAALREAVAAAREEAVRRA